MKGICLVVDYNTNAILARTQSASCAAHVSLGLVNTYSTNIATDLPWINNAVAEYDFNKDHLRMNYSRDKNGKVHYVIPLAEKLKTPEYYERKRIATIRTKYIYAQEAHYRLFLNRVTCVPEQMMGLYSSLSYELLISNDDNGIYSIGILEYAEVRNITPKEAYHELKIMTESTNTANMKYLGWYKTLVENINKMYDEDEINNYVKSVWAKLHEASAL
jgi:hypothetical protein